MSDSSFRYSIITAFSDELPDYVDFVIESALDPKTYRYSVVLRLELLRLKLDLTTRQCDEAACEALGYRRPSPGEPLPEAYRAVKSRAHAYRERWITSRFASKQSQHNQHASVGDSYVKAA